MMKRLFLMLFLVVLLSSAFSQQQVLDQRLTLHYDSIRFEALMDTLSVSLKLSFSYDASLIPGDSVLRVHVDSMRLGHWLNAVFKKEQVHLYQFDRQVVLAREPARLSEQSVTVSGQVMDVAGHKSLDMVNIGIEGESIGTITNEEGRFELIVPPACIGKQLIFSRLGYKSHRLTVASNDTMMTVCLDEKVIQLPEVLVRYVDPYLVMQKVVQNLEQNYASVPTILTAFFRELIQQDSRYVDVSEAVIEIYKPSYSSAMASERVRFVKGRKGQETSKMDVIHFKLQGGPLLFSQLDIVRQGTFLPNRASESQYEYSYNGMDFEQDRLVYVIGFKPVHDTGELLYQGEMRVDKSTFAVVGASFGMSRNTLRRSRQYLVRKDARRFRTHPYVARYNIDYRPVNGEWMLNSVRGEVRIKIIDRARNLKSVFNTVSEMVVTELRQGNQQRFGWTDSFRFNQILSEEIDQERTDSTFWSRYNIIKPNESIREVFKATQ